MQTMFCLHWVTTPTPTPSKVSHWILTNPMTSKYFKHFSSHLGHWSCQSSNTHLRLTNLFSLGWTTMMCSGCSDLAFFFCSQGAPSSVKERSSNKRRKSVWRATWEKPEVDSSIKGFGVDSTLEHPKLVCTSWTLPMSVKVSMTFKASSAMDQGPGMGYFRTFKKLAEYFQLQRCQELLNILRPKTWEVWAIRPSVNLWINSLRTQAVPAQGRAALHVLQIDGPSYERLSFAPAMRRCGTHHDWKTVWFSRFCKTNSIMKIAFGCMIEWKSYKSFVEKIEELIGKCSLLSVPRQAAICQSVVANLDVGKWFSSKPWVHKRDLQKRSLLLTLRPGFGERASKDLICLWNANMCFRPSTPPQNLDLMNFCYFCKRNNNAR